MAGLRRGVNMTYVILTLVNVKSWAPKIQIVGRSKRSGFENGGGGRIEQKNSKRSNNEGYII